MKTLTVWQPWASLVIEGAKPYEFRSWRPPASVIGQRIVIHAASRPTKVSELSEMLADLEAGGEQAAMTCLHVELAKPIVLRARWNATGLPLASGIGTAIVGEPRSGPEIAEEFGLTRVNDSDRDEHANWGWPMLEIERWDDPIPMRGYQGLWNWPVPADLAL
ncbi:MAG: ASCH domain-containing protein [Pseudomonadota bacterium]